MDTNAHVRKQRYAFPLNTLNISQLLLHTHAYCISIKFNDKGDINVNVTYNILFSVSVFRKQLAVVAVIRKSTFPILCFNCYWDR